MNSIKPFVAQTLKSVFLWCRLALLLQACIILAFSFFVSPDDIESGAVVISRTCPSLEATNTPCMGCGVTRSVAAMGGFEWFRAWNYNPLGVFIFVIELALLLTLINVWRLMSFLKFKS